MSFEFISFPNEILRQVGSRLDSLPSVLALASTCTTFYNKSIVMLLGHEENLGKYLAKALEYQNLGMIKRIRAMLQEVDVSRIVVPIELHALSKRISLIQSRFQSLRLHLQVDMPSQKALEEANWPLSLEKLTLRSQHITLAGLQRLVSRCTQLKELDVQQSNLDAVGLRYILQHCQTLQVVDFHRCNAIALEDVLDMQVPPTIKQLKGLKQLVSSYMPIAVEIAARAVLPTVAPLAALVYGRLNMGESADAELAHLHTVAPDYILE